MTDPGSGLVLLRRILHGGDAFDDADGVFAAYAIRQHVAPWVLGVAGARLPGPCAEVLRDEVERRRDRASRLPAALGEALAACARAGVAVRVLKGLPFAVRYYGDPSLRRQVDFDLLVRERDADRGLRVLLGLGYGVRARRLRDTRDGPALRPHRLRTEHALALHREDVTADLHWRLRTAPAYRIREDDVWAGALTVRIGDLECPVPGDEYALVLLLLSIAHDLGRGGCRLKHLLDVWHLLRHPRARLDAEAFLGRRDAENTLGVCGNAIEVFFDAFACRDAFPELAAAVARSPFRRAGDDAVALLHRPPGSVANALWFKRAYPVRWGRDAAFWIDRSLSHPARLPLALYRAGKFGVGALRHVFRPR